MTLPDGTTAEFWVPAGTATFGPAGAHQPKNTSASAWEVVEVELKPRDSGQGEPGVVTYVDGVPQLTTGSTNLPLFGLERIELLREKQQQRKPRLSGHELDFGDSAHA